LKELVIDFAQCYPKLRIEFISGAGENQHFYFVYGR